MPIQRIPFFSHVYKQTKGTGINPNGPYLNPMKGFRKVSAVGAAVNMNLYD